MEPRHKRTESWEGWPVTSMEDVADLAAYMENLIEEAGSKSAAAKIRVSCPDRTYSRLTIDDLREDDGSLSFDDVERIWVSVGEEADVVAAELWLMNTGARSDFDVSGVNRTAVEGVNVQGKEEVQKWLDGKRPRKKRSDPIAPEPAQLLSLPHPTWKRWLNHQWTVVIVGTLIATVVGGAILALLLH